ncbi:MAG: protein-tyrosine phosphatase [Gaiellaceae bacterium]|nr:protein-tyrosine phosphatase [Gaiellaceae bacterium]
MIDLHTHVLPGVDDGPRTLEESLDVLRSMRKDGVRTVAATPHVREDWPTTAERMHTAVAALTGAAREAAIEIEVLPGGEVDLGRLVSLSPEERAGFGLGGNPHLLLLEFPYVGWPMGLADIVFRLRSAGIVTLLAHPERNPEVQAEPERLREVVRGGALVQLTAGSVDGRMGARSKKCALRLLELELAHVLASDAHAPSVRAAGLAAAADALGSLGRWMASDVPAALLEGSELPPRPGRASRRGWFGRRPGRR